MEKDIGAGMLAGTAALVLLLFLIYGIAAFTSSEAVLWQGQKWTCTNTRYPLPDKQEMFAPYCVQWTMEKP